MNYKLTIVTRTPLHIGTNIELMNLYDFQVDQKRGKTYRLKVDAILEQALSAANEQLDRQLLTRPPAELVTLAELRRSSEFVLYTLDGLPQPTTNAAGRVREQLKDVWGQLYLPGSSLKGALRTAIAHNIAQDQEMALRVNPEGNNPKQAGNFIERDIFRVARDQIKPGHNEMNHDLLRALQVADSRPVTVDPLLVNVRVVKGNKQKAPIDVEAVPPATTFETTIHTEPYLYRDKAAELGWDKAHTKWLENLPVAARNVARKRFQQEITYFTEVGLTNIVKVYQQFQNDLKEMRGGPRFFLQLGWGGGWENKTMGRELLASDEATFADLRHRFKLGHPPREGDSFPSSRRLVVNRQGRPMVPLGWVEVMAEKQA